MRKVYKLTIVGSSLLAGGVIIATAFAQVPNPQLVTKQIINSTVNPIVVQKPPIINGAVPVNVVGSGSTNANVPTGVGINSVKTATLAGTNVQAPSDGNTYEKEVTPLLRDISRLKAQLEIKKLQAETEKIDMEIIKSQQDKSNGNLINVQNLNNTPFNMPNSGGITAFNPSAMSSGTPSSVQQQTNFSSLNNGIRVIMIFGYDNNLYAKISAGEQGGYVVKKGDILPNGKIVANVFPNYIEIKKGIKKKNKTERIYVTGPVQVDANGQKTNINKGESMNSANIPSIGPISVPQNISSSNTIKMGNGSNGNNANKLVITPLQLQ